MRWLLASVLLVSGCGDAPVCPEGTKRQRVPLEDGDPLTAARYECVKVVMTMVVPLSVGGVGSGGGPMSDTAGDVPGTGAID
jgi:hypothetical protein